MQCLKASELKITNCFDLDYNLCSVLLLYACYHNNDKINLVLFVSLQVAFIVLALISTPKLKVIKMLSVVLRIPGELVDMRTIKRTEKEHFRF